MAGDNFDLAKWSDITPINDGAECDITSMKVAVFSFDLDAWETRCATVTGGCTFEKTYYEPYAVGILWKQLGITACSYNGPYIMTKPGPPARTLPFEGLYWRHNPNAVEVYYNVTYNYNNSSGNY